MNLVQHNYASDEQGFDTTVSFYN